MMKTNVKPGDLAIVIGANFCTGNIGRIVEVVRRAEPGVFFCPRDADEVAWIVRSDRPLYVVSIHNEIRMNRWGVAYHDDRHLRPVSGLPVSEYQERDIDA